ncbi:MAG: ferredoxin [Candidatus Methylomirabilales bacterium]
MARQLRVEVDHNKCVGSTMCILTAPRAFLLNENRQSVPADLEAHPTDLIVEAAAQCPQVAIIVTDAETGETLFPPHR